MCAKPSDGLRLGIADGVSARCSILICDCHIQRRYAWAALAWRVEDLQRGETGLLSQEIDRAVAAPIESLAVRLGQTQLDTPVVAKPWTYARRVSIAGRADSLTVNVAILPLSPLQRPDSVTQTVLRTR